jgi:hypothetical protein
VPAEARGRQWSHRSTSSGQKLRVKHMEARCAALEKHKGKSERRAAQEGEQEGRIHR